MVSELSFAELRDQVMTQYFAGKYTEALELATQQAAHFSAQANDLYHWRICLTCLARGVPAALALMQEAVAAGFWLSAVALHREPDLAAAQGHPEFERLVAICQERADAAQATVMPFQITLPPAEPRRSGRLLIALHANGSKAHESQAYWQPATAAGWNVLLPQSTQVFGPDNFVWNDRERAVGEIRRHYAEFRATHPDAGLRTVIGGFSRGGGTAIWLALAEDLGATGFIAVGPSLTNMAELRAQMANRPPQGVRGYIIVGDLDPQCLEISQAVAALMQEHALPCELVVRPGLRHAFPSDFDSVLRSALRFVLPGVP